MLPTRLGVPRSVEGPQLVWIRDFVVALLGVVYRGFLFMAYFDFVYYGFVHPGVAWADRAERHLCMSDFDYGPNGRDACTGVTCWPCTGRADALAVIAGPMSRSAKMAPRTSTALVPYGVATQALRFRSLSR